MNETLKKFIGMRNFAWNVIVMLDLLRSQPTLYNFVLDKPIGHKLIKKPKGKQYKKANKYNLYG